MRRVAELVCRALVGLLMTAVQAQAVQAENTAPDALEVPPGMFTLDAARVADERTGNAVVDATREALARTGVLFAPVEIRELSLRDAALAALQRNLDIKRSGLNKSVVQRTLIEAEAVFDPVFTLSTSGTMSRSFTRVERPMQWKPATQEYVRGQPDQNQQVPGQRFPVWGNDRRPGSARGHAGEIPDRSADHAGRQRSVSRTGLACDRSGGPGQFRQAAGRRLLSGP